MSRDALEELPRLGVVLDRHAEERTTAPEVDPQYGGATTPSRPPRRSRLALAVMVMLLAGGAALVASRAATDAPDAVASPSTDTPPIVAVLPPPSWAQADERHVEPPDEDRSRGALLASLTGDIEHSVMVEILDEPMNDDAEAAVVHVGHLEGFYIADEASGRSVLVVGDDQVRVELVASTDFSRSQLVELAAEIDPALRADQQTLGPDWKLLAAERSDASRIVRSYSVQAEGIDGRVAVRNIYSDQESDLWFVGGAHLARGQTVRGAAGYVNYDPSTSTVRLAWHEAPNLVIELTYQSGAEDPTREARRLAESLVAADEATWEQFVE